MQSERRNATQKRCKLRLRDAGARASRAARVDSGGTRSRRRAHKAHGARISGGADLASTGWAVSANAQADINPNLYPNRGQQGWEWQAAPGPNKRGAMCVTHTDALRGYGFQSP